MANKTSYKPELCERATNFALMGYTNVQLADALAVPLRTLERWLKVHEAFRVAIQDGRDIADGKVAASLFRRAIGFTGPDGKYYPPENTAMIFWLKNRQKAVWRDKQEIEHSGEITYKDLTDEELAHKIAEYAKP